MRVGVVDAGLRHLADVGAEEVGCELRRPLGRQAVAGVELAAVDPLEHEQPLGHVGPDHLRHDEIVVVLELRGDQLGVVGLLDEVELGAEVDLELVRERARLQQLGGLGALLEELDGRADEGEVDVDLLDDARPAHLDHHLSAVREQRRVDLRDRGGGQRLRVELDDRVADVFPHDPLDLREGEGRHLVHQLRELVDVDVREQVRARGEQLAELEEGRAELLEGLAELDRALTRGGPAAGDAQLAQHAHELAPARDADDFAGTPRTVESGGHPCFFPARAGAANA